MNENIEIELFNELPKFFFGNEKYLLLHGRVSDLSSFKNCTLYINDVTIATSKPYISFNEKTQKIAANVFQFMVELPSLKNEKEINISIEIITNLKERLVDIASIPIKKRQQKFETEKAKMVAVCMPLYQPKLKLFKRQLQSILKQSHENIKIFILDDCSEATVFNEVKEYISAFDNVILLRNDENIGFYKNIELLLNKIGDSFEYVALSDQDDIWELDKLEKQIDFLKEKKADLCYTDLKIVDEANTVIQNSFWHNRSNHLQSSFALNLRNVATGATMLFKQSILNDVLPFPQQIGKVFHDHYICARLQNSTQYKVVYLNEKLSSYVQHSTNVTGFSKFKAQKFKDKLISDVAFIKLFLQLISKKNIEEFESLLKGSEKYFYNNFQRLKLFLLHQGKLNNSNFFSSWLMIKIMFQTFFLSYKMYISNIWLNRFDAVIYKRIAAQVGLKLRYWLYKK